jgi:hypothetical protein
MKRLATPLRPQRVQSRVEHTLPRICRPLHLISRLKFRICSFIGRTKRRSLLTTVGFKLVGAGRDRRPNAHPPHPERRPSAQVPRSRHDYPRAVCYRAVVSGSQRLNVSLKNAVQPARCDPGRQNASGLTKTKRSRVHQCEFFRGKRENSLTLMISEPVNGGTT